MSAKETSRDDSRTARNGAAGALGDVDNLDQAKDIERHSPINVTLLESAVPGSMLVHARRMTSVFTVISTRLTLCPTITVAMCLYATEAFLNRGVHVIFGRAYCGHCRGEYKILRTLVRHPNDRPEVITVVESLERKGEEHLACYADTAAVGQRDT